MPGSSIHLVPGSVTTVTVADSAASQVEPNHMAAPSAAEGAATIHEENDTARVYRWSRRSAMHGPKYPCILGRACHSCMTWMTLPLWPVRSEYDGTVHGGFIVWVLAIIVVAGRASAFTDRVLPRPDWFSSDCSVVNHSRINTQETMSHRSGRSSHDPGTSLASLQDLIFQAREAVGQKVTGSMYPAAWKPCAQTSQ